MEFYVERQGLFRWDVRWIHKYGSILVASCWTRYGAWRLIDCLHRVEEQKAEVLKYDKQIASWAFTQHRN